MFNSKLGLMFVFMSQTQNLNHGGSKQTSEENVNSRSQFVQSPGPGERSLSRGNKEGIQVCIKIC